MKLADFGLARIYERGSKEPMSHQVATRQYRAPELLFASRHYTPAVDMWSVAVVMSELVSSQMLFPGNNDIDQMHKVFQVLGSPSLIDWPVSRMLQYRPDWWSCAGTAGCAYIPHTNTTRIIPRSFKAMYQLRNQINYYLLFLSIRRWSACPIIAKYAFPT